MTIERPEQETGGLAYVLALIVLLALTGVSYGFAFVELGALGPVIAFSIAGVKVLIVAFVFMHLHEAMFATRFVALVTILFLVIVCLGILSDVLFR